MRVRRDISALPHRSASETWAAIMGLITGTDSRDAQQLVAASGVMGSIIADEHPAARPMVLEGVGPQLRLYCVYGFRAIEQGSALDVLNWNPTAGEWTLHVPCDGENFAWVKASLKKTSPRIQVFDVANEDHSDTDASSSEEASAQNLFVDWSVKG